MWRRTDLYAGGRIAASDHNVHVMSLPEITADSTLSPGNPYLERDFLSIIA
jgi:hypothetical protein